MVFLLCLLSFLATMVVGTIHQFYSHHVDQFEDGLDVLPVMIVFLVSGMLLVGVVWILKG